MIRRSFIILIFSFLTGNALVSIIQIIYPKNEEKPKK